MDLLEVDVLTGKVSVDGREGVELVLEQVLVFGVEEAVCQYSTTNQQQRHTLG
jgi:hypothetical protein